MKVHSNTLVLASLAGTAFCAPANGSSCGLPSGGCKNVPGLPGWPTDTDWSSLNTTVSGRLLKPPPPAAACHAPNFDNATCTNIQKQFGDAEFHILNPISVILQNGNNDSCLPDPRAPCSGAGFPIYVVNATTAEHVKAGIDFARQKRVRLVVKGTGHDYLERSSGANALSIWTHYLRGPSFTKNFQPAGCSSGLGLDSINVPAGHTWGEVHDFAQKYNVTIVSGAAGTVGVGGYLTGGGHSPISATYGLGSDNVLEFEVVTAAGEILKANECQNQDLFWALRGGGGSTFGVITNVVLKAIRPLPGVVFLFQANTTTSNSDAYWNISTEILAQTPHLVESGFQGYQYFSPETPFDPANSTHLIGQINSILFIFNKTVEEARALFSPVEKAVNGSTYASEVTSGDIVLESSDFFGFLNGPATAFAYAGGDALYDSRLGSRLLPKSAFEVDKETLLSAHKKFGSDSYISHLVAGKGVNSTVPRGGSSAVNPAWRDAYTHIVITAGWQPLNRTAKANSLDNLHNNLMPALRSLAPDSGCYINEADFEEPDLGRSFWGSNYPKLRQLKGVFDPESVFWCKGCVGHEEWLEQNGRLCPA